MSIKEPLLFGPLDNWALNMMRDAPDQFRNSMTRQSPRALAVAGIGMVSIMAFSAYAWNSGWIPRSIKDTKSVIVQLNDGSGKIYRTQIRTIYLPGLTGWRSGPPTATAEEVKLPGGRWADCGADCKAVFRAAVIATN